MHPFQFQPIIPLSETTGIRCATAFVRLARLLAAIMSRWNISKGSDARGYDGYAWCDSSERQLNFDIATCRRTRFP
jgi:hypothetical protein